MLKIWSLGSCDHYSVEAHNSFQVYSCSSSLIYSLDTGNQKKAAKQNPTFSHWQQHFTIPQLLGPVPCLGIIKKLCLHTSVKFSTGSGFTIKINWPRTLAFHRFLASLACYRIDGELHPRHWRICDLLQRAASEITSWSHYMCLNVNQKGK